MSPGHCTRRKREERLNNSTGFVFMLGTVGLCAVLLMACGTTSRFSPGSGNKYQYAYRMASPAESDSMLYRDENIIVQFRIDEAAVRFQLQNISSSDITIDWGDVSLGVNGKFSPVRHSQDLYADSAIVPSAVTLPPIAFIRDLFIPRDNIAPVDGRWVEADLLPTTDNGSDDRRTSILKSVGTSLTLSMPLKVGSTSKIYAFEFRVAQVDRIAWRDYKPGKRIPAPPAVPQKPQRLDQVAMAVIVVGVLGFAAYVLTVKKNPPTE